MTGPRKRAAEEGASSHQDKRPKSQKAKKWRVERKGRPRTTIEPGDMGILATCTRGKERKAEDELQALLEHYVQEMYPATASASAESPEDDASDRDIEADIHREISQMKTPDNRDLLRAVKIDMECVVFFKAKPPIEVTALVHRICEDARQNRRPQHTRTVMRLTPVTLIGKASEHGLGEVGRTVLAPYFHQAEQESKKFAIRPTIRNNTSLDRDTVIKQVAQTVGQDHAVDLKHYDLLVLVDIWMNLCGMAVVGSDFEVLKRYNLAELHAAARSLPPSTAGDVSLGKD